MRRRFLAETLLFDLLSLGLALFAASTYGFGVLNPLRITPSNASMIGIVATTALIMGYANARSWGAAAPRPSFGRAVFVNASTIAISAMAIVATRVGFSRRLLGLWMAMWLGSMFIHRAIRRRRPWRESMIVISADKTVVEQLRDAPHAQVLQQIDPNDVAPQLPADRDTSLVVDLRAVMSDRMAQFVASAGIAGYSVRALSSVYEEHTGRIPIFHLAEGWELLVPISAKGWYVALKRVVETVVVLATAPLSALISAGVALAVLIDSGRPVIFRQERVGLHSRAFTIFKFRTMVEHDHNGSSLYATDDDPRFTRIGPTLRKYRLDELPQLLNVVRGDLSLVGPRPEWDVLAKVYSDEIPFYEHRHLVRPGITGWAQVNQGYTASIEEVVEKLSFDLYYVKHMSGWLDVRVWGRSISAMLTGFGAK